MLLKIRLLPAKGHGISMGWNLSRMEGRSFCQHYRVSKSTPMAQKTGPQIQGILLSFIISDFTSKKNPSGTQWYSFWCLPKTKSQNSSDLAMNKLRPCTPSVLFCDGMPLFSFTSGWSRYINICWGVHFIVKWTVTCYTQDDQENDLGLESLLKL